MNILDLLMVEEGFSEGPYYCSEGFPTIGIGQRIGPKGADLSLYEFNVSKTVAHAWLKEKVMHIENDLQKYDWFDKLTGNRRAVIVSMSYQLGITGLLKFKNMIKAINIGDFDLAALEALDSRWATQTPGRAMRHAKVLASGFVEGVY